MVICSGSLVNGLGPVWDIAKKETINITKKEKKIENKNQANIKHNEHMFGVRSVCNRRVRT